MPPAPSVRGLRSRRSAGWTARAATSTTPRRADADEVLCNYFVCSLPPGNRKSAVEGRCKAPFVEWEAEGAIEIEPAIRIARSNVKTDEARLKALRAAAANPKTKPNDVQRHIDEIADIERDMPDVPTVPRLWTSDPTPESLGVRLAENGEAMAVLSSEGDVFDVLAGRYSKGAPNLGLVLKAHDGDSDIVDRLGRDTVRLTCPRLTLGLSVQPSVLEGLADSPGFSGRGLIARILFFLPRSPLGTRSHEGPPVPESVGAAYTRGVRAMLDWPAASDGCHVVTLSDAARHEWCEFRQFIEPLLAGDTDDDARRAWHAKAPGHALRLAAVLHAVLHAHGEPWEHPVDAATMTAALDIMAVVTEHSRTALAMMGTSPAQTDARRVLAHLRAKAPGGCSVRDIHGAMKARFERVARLHAALSVLEERGYVQVVESEPSGKAGRPSSPTVFVRPETGGVR